MISGVSLLFAACNQVFLLRPKGFRGTHDAHLDIFSLHIGNGDPFRSEIDALS